MLEVSRAFAVFCPYCPTVFFEYYILASPVNHRFAADAHTAAQQRSATGSSVVGYFWFFMHLTSATVAYQLSDNRVTFRLAVSLHCMTDVPYPFAFYGMLDTEIKRLFCCLQQFIWYGFNAFDNESWKRCISVRNSDCRGVFEPGRSLCPQI